MNKLSESQLFKLSKEEVLNVQDIGLKLPISANTPSLILENLREYVSKVSLIADNMLGSNTIFLFIIELPENCIVIPVDKTNPNEDTLDHIVERYIAPIIYINLLDKFYINKDLTPQTHHALLKQLLNIINSDKKKVPLVSINKLACAKQIAHKEVCLDYLRKHLHTNTFDDSHSTYDLYQAHLKVSVNLKA